MPTTVWITIGIIFIVVWGLTAIEIYNIMRNNKLKQK